MINIFVVRGRAAARRSALLLCFVCLVLLVSCKSADKGLDAAPVPAVHTTVVKKNDLPPLQLRGPVQTRSRATLGFGVSGMISAILVKQGDTVTKGQVLGRLNTADAFSQMRAANAARAKAGRDWSAASRLAKSGAVPNSVRDDARAALESAEANLNLARTNLGRTDLISPINGTVVQRSGQPGEAVAAGSPVIVVDDTGDLVVKVSVTDRDLPRLKLGQQAWLRADAPPSLVGEQESDARPAKVTTLAPIPNPSDGLYDVEITPEKAVLQTGELMYVRIESSQTDQILSVTLDAIVRRRDSTWVFLVDGAQDKTVARIRKVKLGRTIGRNVEVRSGLTEGMTIITEGAYYLQDGQPVRTLSEEQK